MTRVVQCPECRHDITFYELPMSGQQISCGHCAADLEVIDPNTMELDWAYKPPVIRDERSPFRPMAIE